MAQAPSSRRSVRSGGSWLHGTRSLACGFLERKAERARSRPNATVKINSRGRCHVWDNVCVLVFVVMLQGLASGCNPRWQEYTSSEGQFFVLMPDSPTEQRSVKQTPCGAVKIVSVDAVLNKRLVFATRGFYSVSYSDIDGSKCGEGPQRILDEERDEAVKNLGGKVVEERDMTKGDDIGREIQLQTPKLGLVKERIHVVGRRVYRVIVGGKTEASSEDAERFLESFRVLSQDPSP